MNSKAVRLLLLLLSAVIAKVHSLEVVENEDDLLKTDPETGAVTYKGFKLIHATPTDEKHLNVLRFLNNGNKQAMFKSRSMCHFSHFFVICCDVDVLPTFFICSAFFQG